MRQHHGQIRWAREGILQALRLEKVKYKVRVAAEQCLEREEVLLADTSTSHCTGRKCFRVRRAHRSAC